MSLNDVSRATVIARFSPYRVIAVVAVYIAIFATFLYEVLSKYGSDIGRYYYRFSDNDILGKILLLALFFLIPLGFSTTRLCLAASTRGMVAIYEKSGILVCRGGISFSEEITKDTTAYIERLGWIPFMNELVVVEFGDGRRRAFSGVAMDVDAAELAARINQLVVR